MDIDTLLAQAQITVLIGKNGSGKSSLLRQLDARQDLETKYISPERGGSLKYDPNVDNNIRANANWLVQTRRKNRFDHFREQSAAQFRNLETAILREIEKDLSKRKDLDYTFDSTLETINKLLPAIKLVRSDQGFAIETKKNEHVDEDAISSGEAELIALAIEVLTFSRDSRAKKILLLDEPDVHLHPDLQHRLARFCVQLAHEFNFKMVVATHSTAIFSGLSEADRLQVVPITDKRQTDYHPFVPDDVSKQLLPVFGTHPLAEHFNERPILLVEGEDDRRVIEQMVRSSNGRFNYSPSVVGGIQNMAKWENWLNEFLPAIYDEPIAFSLRDLDDTEGTAIDDLQYVRRARLNCYAIENLLVTSDSLTAHGVTELAFQETIQAWLNARPNHQCAGSLTEFLNHFSERRTRTIKDIRNVLCALLGSAKPWEVEVGQLLAHGDLKTGDGEHCLFNYLGRQCAEKIFQSQFVTANGHLVARAAGG